MHWAEVQLCVWRKHLFSVVFYVVRTAQKFDFRLVMRAVRNKWWPVERKSWSDTDLRFWQDIYVCFISTVARSVKGFYPRFAGRLCSLRQYLFWQAEKCVGNVAHAHSSGVGFLPWSELIHDDDEAADYVLRYEIIRYTFSHTCAFRTYRHVRSFPK